MQLELAPSEKITVTFQGSDGNITVGFDEKRIFVETDWPDTDGRTGTLYEEKFGDPPKDEDS